MSITHYLTAAKDLAFGFLGGAPYRTIRREGLQPLGRGTSVEENYMMACNVIITGNQALLCAANPLDPCVILPCCISCIPNMLDLPQQIRLGKIRPNKSSIEVKYPVSIEDSVITTQPAAQQEFKKNILLLPKPRSIDRLAECITCQQIPQSRLHADCTIISGCAATGFALTGTAMCAPPIINHLATSGWCCCLPTEGCIPALATSAVYCLRFSDCARNTLYHYNVRTGNILFESELGGIEIKFPEDNTPTKIGNKAFSLCIQRMVELDTAGNLDAQTALINFKGLLNLPKLTCLKALNKIAASVRLSDYFLTAETTNLSTNDFKKLLHAVENAIDHPHDD